MKHRSLSHILIRLSVFFAAAAAGPALRAQSFEPFSPYGIFSPSVESYQMTRCGNLLPSLYTGAMTFSLPLMTYSDPDFTIPVTLEYSFDGYKPGQHSGSVGYGWYLDCGGVITREVRGIPDEGDLDRNENYPCAIHGWRQTGPFRSLTDFQAGDIYSIQKRPVDFVPVDECIGLLEGYDPFFDTPMYAVFNHNNQNYNLYDTAPDIYHFRLLGHSGDFMMLPDGSVRVFNSDIPHGELSVSFTDHEGFPWNVIITLTTGDGYEYRFGCEDLSEIPHCNADRPNRVSKAVSSYHLMQITAPNGRSVSLSYTQQLNPVILPRYNTILDGVCSTNGVWMDEEYYNVFSSTGNDFSWTFVREATHILDKITIRDASGQAAADSLVFRYIVRQDTENDRACFEWASQSCYEWLGPPRLLASISMYGQDGLADHASLSYQNAANGTPKSFLMSVAGMKTGRHVFDYNYLDFDLPPNDTQDTDHWGYWNGSSISDLRKHLTETSWMYSQGNGTEGVLHDEDTDSTYVVELPDTAMVRRRATHLYDQMTDNAKEANSAFSVCGALIRIHYPHGGTTDVEYEPNCVTRRMNVRATENLRSLEPVDSLDATTTWTVGGVRVMRFVDSDGHGHRDTTQFSYTVPDDDRQQSGILMSMPKYAETVQFVHRANASYDHHGMVGMAVVNAIGFNNCCGFVLNRDPHVVYPSVRVIHPDGSSVEHRFTSVTDPGRNDSHSFLFGIPKHIFGPSDWFESEGRVPTCMIPASLDCRGLRGQPLSIVVRDNTGNELHRTEHAYAYDQVIIPRLCFNNILTYNIASYTVRSPQLVSTTETERGVTVRTDRSYNALGQVSVTSTVGGNGTAAGDTLRMRLRYRHETGDTSRFRTLPEAAARTLALGTGEYLLAREHYSYKPGTPRLSGILSYAPDDPVIIPPQSSAFSVAAGTPRVSAFQYGPDQRLTGVALPGENILNYTWDGTRLTSKAVNGASNITTFAWKDLVGLTQVTDPSGQVERYEYDARNRPWKAIDTDGQTTSVFNYKTKNE